MNHDECELCGKVVDDEWFWFGSYDLLCQNCFDGLFHERQDVPCGGGLRRIPPDPEWAVELTEPKAVFHLCGDGWNRLAAWWLHPDPCYQCGKTMPKQTAKLIGLFLNPHA